MQGTVALSAPRDYRVTDQNVQGYSYGLLHGLGGLGFVMFHYPAWAVGMYSSGPLAGGTPQIQVHPTHVADRMNNPVLRGCRRGLRWCAEKA